MSSSNLIRANNVDTNNPNDKSIPSGWKKTLEEYRKPVNDVSGYYIYNYESEDFLVTRDCEVRKNGERVHTTTLLRVKRDEDGERLTAIGTGVYKDVAINQDKPSYMEDREENIEAHEEAKEAAFQIAINLMREVNAGEYDHKKFDD